MLTAQAAYEAHREQVARLQSFVDRFGAKTMGAGLGAVASQDHIAAAPKATGRSRPSCWSCAVLVISLTGAVLVISHDR